jgi:putative membrane protein
MGIANLIPGVSGGTMALIGGIYDQLISSINSVASLKKNRDAVFFLLTIIAGITISIFGFSHLISMAMERIPGYTYGCFIGLVGGSIPFVMKRRTKGKRSNYLFMLLGIVLVVLLTFTAGDPGKVNETGEVTHSIGSLVYDSIAGFFGAASMILPGLSGAFILLIMNEYERIVNAVSSMDILILLFTAVGIFLGIILISRFLKKLLVKFPSATFSFLAGLMIGSIPDLALRAGTYPEVAFRVLGGTLFGLLMSFFLSKAGQRNDEEM